MIKRSCLRMVLILSFKNSRFEYFLMRFFSHLLYLTSFVYFFFLYFHFSSVQSFRFWPQTTFLELFLLNHYFAIDFSPNKKRLLFFWAFWGHFDFNEGGLKWWFDWDRTFLKNFEKYKNFHWSHGEDRKRFILELNRFQSITVWMTQSAWLLFWV